MAAFNEPQQTPNVGIRGNPESQVTLKKSESLVGPGSTPAFTAAFIDLASTPSAMAQVGSKMAQASAQALGAKWGAEAGETPHGNMSIPAITDFDKAYSDSYSAQAQVSLNLQAENMMSKAQEDIQKLDRITPDIIASYNENMKQGLQENLDLAPDNVRTRMEAQYGSSLIRTTSALNQKMISQNKTEALGNASVWRSTQNALAQNAIKDGDLKQGKAIFDSVEDNIKAARNANQMSPVEAETAILQNKMNYQSSLSILKLMDARAAGKSDEYLNSIADKKIGNLTWSESEQVRDNTVSYLSHVEAAANREQTLLTAQASNEMALGTFNSDRLAYYRSVQTPTHFLNTSTQFAVRQRKAGADDGKVRGIIANPLNPASYDGTTAKIKNNAFDELSLAAMNKAQSNREPISKEEADYQAANAMAIPVPKYINHLNNMMSSGNASDKMRGMEEFYRLHDENGFKTTGVNDRALASAEMFRGLLGNYADPNEAAAEANRITADTSDKTLQLVREKTEYYFKNHISDPTRATSWAVNTSGISGGEGFIDEAGFTADIKNQMAGYLMLTHNDEAASKRMTEAYTRKTYGLTKVNGKVEVAFLGLEKATNIDVGGAPLFQQDIINSLTSKFDEGKKSFDSGNSPSYFRFKAGRVSFDEYMKAKIEIDEGMTMGKLFHAARSTSVETELETGKSGVTALYKSYASQRAMVKQFERGDAIEVEQVYRRGEAKTHKLMVQTTPYSSVSPVSGQILGGYNFKIRDELTGIPHTLYGHFGVGKTSAEYKPDSKWIQDRYIALHGYQSDMTWEQYQVDKEARGQAYSKSVTALLKSIN